MNAPKQRASTRRSRAGCRTCRLRHIKCDETPVSCKNCLNSGWKCDGYENRLAHLPKEKRTNTSASLSLQGIATPLPGRSSDERRAFAFFQKCTVPEMSSLFATRLWNHLVLPMSHAEQAVTHAAVALSTLHEDMKARGAPLSSENLANDRHRFALEQYTRALSSLNARRHSNDPKLPEVLLTCCLLFVFFELLRGQYDPAFAHLQRGLSIIKELHANPHARQKSTLPSPRSLTSNFTADIETSLVEAMTRLHYQSTFFGVDVSRSQPLVAEPATQEDGCFFKEFDTIPEARRHLDGLFNKSCRVVSSFARLSTEEQLLDSNRLNFEAEQQKLRTECAEFLDRLNRSEAKLLHSGWEEAQRAIDLIRLQHKTCHLMLETFIEKEGLSYALYTDEFRELVTTSERIAHSICEGNGPESRSQPTLLLDIAIIPALTYVCVKCADSSLRRQALRNLVAWPHREGPWDSNLLAVMASELIQVETEAELRRLSAVEAVPGGLDLDIAYISPASRVTEPSLIVEDDQTRAVLKYNTRGRGQGTLAKEKWITLE